MSIKWDSKGLITLWSGQGLKALAGVGQRPTRAAGRSAKGELKNSPVDCFLRGNALQERAFPYFILFK